MINLVTDSLPAIALGMEAVEDDIMDLDEEDGDNITSDETEDTDDQE